MTVAGGKQLPDLPGEVIFSRQRGRQWQLLVRAMEDYQYEALDEQSEIVAVEIRTPALEEIFVAYMQSDKVSEGQVARVADLVSP